MKTLYLDLGMGAAGDMLTAALIDILPDKEPFLERLNGLGIPNVTYSLKNVEKNGIHGSHISVLINGQEEKCEDIHEHSHKHSYEHSHEQDLYHCHEIVNDDNHHDHEQQHNIHEKHHIHENHDHVHSHTHTSLHDINHIISDHMKLTGRIKDDVLAVYTIIAEAESQVHGVPVNEIHFHEVGNMDAIADITAVCMLIDEISPDEIVASPIHVGSGHVHCAHGILPVPAPATALILKGLPIYSGSIKGELCTPTGAALLKHFVTRFGDMPIMKVSAIGYGMGNKEFEMLNCVRAMIGETGDKADTIIELSCNMDDTTGEQLGFAFEKLFEVGAVDVYTLPICMKKNRPGNLLRVMCKENDKSAVISAIFKYTSTIGIREQVMNRYVLDREIEKVNTAFGTIHRKHTFGYGVDRYKWEYEDLRNVANDKGISIDEVIKMLENQ